MKAIKSVLAKQISESGIRIPLKENSVFVFNGKMYKIKHIPTRQQ
jgi:hypothetical protein